MEFNEYTNAPEATAPKNKPRKSSGAAKSIVTVLLCVLLGGGAGFLGGYYAKGGSRTIILQQTQTPTPKSTEQTVFDGTVFTQSQAGSDDPLTIAEIAAKVQPAVVEVTTETVTTDSRLKQYVSKGAGSGVIFRQDGYIVTNNHVIDSAGKITVTLHNGASYEASVIGTDEQTDLAVLKIDAENLDIAQFGDSSSLIVGQTAVAVGNPLGTLGGTVTNGIISALDREITIDSETMTLLQTNAAVNPGNSGGGLFDAHGTLIGIVNAKSSGENLEGLGFAIPVNTVKTVITDLVQTGYVRGRVDTGLTLIDITDSVTAMQYRVSYYGVYVYSVDNDSPAYESGIRSGDCILTLDGTEIASCAEFNRLIRGHSVGDSITLALPPEPKLHLHPHRAHGQDLRLSAYPAFFGAGGRRQARPRSALYAVRKDRIGIRIKNTPYRLNDTEYFYLYIRDVIPALTVSSLFCGEAHPLPPSRSALLRAKHKKTALLRQYRKNTVFLFLFCIDF